MPTETVTVLLSSEVISQRVPDIGTHNSEGPTAECGEPVSWYDELQMTLRPICDIFLLVVLPVTYQFLVISLI